MKLFSIYLVLFTLAVSNIKFICGINILNEFSDDDDESGSGSEEDPMTLTKDRHDGELAIGQHRQCPCFKPANIVNSKIQSKFFLSNSMSCSIKISIFAH